MAQRGTLFGELQVAWRRLTGASGTVVDLPAPEIGPTQEPTATSFLSEGHAHPRRRVTRLVVGWSFGAFAGIAAVVLVVNAAELKAAWAEGLLYLGLCGGISAMCFVGGRSNHRGASMTAAAIVGFSVLIVGAALSPPSKSASHASPAAATSAGSSAVAVAAARTQAPTSTTAPQTATPRPTSTRVAPSTPTPTVFVDPTPALLARIEKSIRDNANASADSPNLDNLRLQFDAKNKLLHVYIEPTKSPRDTELISNGSALAVITGRAIWSTYPEVNFITIVVQKPSNGGSTPVTGMVTAIYTRATFGLTDFSQLRGTTGDDNKTMLCKADFYSLDHNLWWSLGDKGCMLASDGGVNPSVAGKSYAIPTNAGLITLQSQRQVDLITFIQQEQGIEAASDHNLTVWKTVTTQWTNGQVDIFTYYNLLKAEQDAWSSLADAVTRLEVPPGLDSSVAELTDLLQNYSDAMGHAAKFLNTSDLEEQHKMTVDLQQAGDDGVGVFASEATVLVQGGLSPVSSALVVTCDPSTQVCILHPANPPSALFKTNEPLE